MCRQVNLVNLCTKQSDLPSRMLEIRHMHASSHFLSCIRSLETGYLLNFSLEKLRSRANDRSEVVRRMALLASNAMISLSLPTF